MDIMRKKMAYFILMSLILVTFAETRNTSITYIVELNVLKEKQPKALQIVIEPLDDRYTLKSPTDIFVPKMDLLDFKKSKTWCKNKRHTYCECHVNRAYKNEKHSGQTFPWRVITDASNDFSIRQSEAEETYIHSVNISKIHCTRRYSVRAQNCYLESFEAEILRAGNIEDNVTYVVHECNKPYQPSAYICGCRLNKKEHCALMGKMHFTEANGTAISTDINLLNDTRLTDVDNIFVTFPRQLIRKCNKSRTEIQNHWNFLEDPHSLKVIDFIFSIISLLSLFLTIFVFATYPELRNLHGKNLMGLAITIFFSQILFLHDSGVANDKLCAAIGGCLHYCWLSVFTWTSVMAYDMAKTFHLNFALTGHQNGENTRRFVTHAVIAWCVPFIIVIMCLLANLEDLETLYGTVVDGGVCMVSHHIAIYGLFLPLALCLVFNVSCFAVIIHGIEKKRRSLRRLPNASSYEKIHCFIYAKISILLGITWIICLIATLSNSRKVWFTFSIMTNIQGMGIFLSFVLLNRRVRILVKRKFRNSTELNECRIATTNKAFRDIQRRKESAFSDADGLGSSRPSTPCASVMFEESEKGSPMSGKRK